MLLRFFLWLNSKFPAIPHPFHQHGKGPMPYAEFEFEQARKIWTLYQIACQKQGVDFSEWLRGKTIVDFCCGGGGKSAYFAVMGASKIIGIDLNPHFIGQAKEIAKEKGIADRMEFIQGDVCQSGLPTASADGVILNDAIDHVGDPKAVLAEAMRILKPSGLLFINFESYLFPWGHHMLDVIGIPWIHLFTTESFRIKLYRALVDKLPDAKERLELRLGHDEKGRERITYLNKLTIRKFQNILQEFTGNRQHRSLRTLAFHKQPLTRKPLRWLGKIPLPLVSELFSSTHLWVLEKTPS